MALSSLTGSENMENHSGYHNTERTQINTNETGVVTNVAAIALNTAKVTYPTADSSKLAAIEALADVTDATNVNAAGATMNTDTDIKANGWVIDENDMVSDDDTKVPTQQSVKYYSDPESTTTTSSSSPSVFGRRNNSLVNLTVLSENTTFPAPSGTPLNGNKIIIRIKDDGTPRTITWNAIYSGIVDTLPTTTTASKVLYIGFMYNSTSSKWEMIALTEEL